MIESARRVVITGAGCVSPLGPTARTTWDGLQQGRSGIGPITLFDAGAFPIRMAAEAREWDLVCQGEHSESWQHVPRQTAFAIGASLEAARCADLADARVEPLRFGVYFGCGEIFPELHELGRVVAGSIARIEGGEEPGIGEAPVGGRIPDDAETPDMACRHVAAFLGAEGPTANCITGCTSSTQAIGNAVEVIRRGEADVMLAGGAHSMIHPMGVSGLHRLGVLSLQNDRMEGAMRPFDRDRDGFVVGEGGAVFVLESAEHACRRKADIWAEVAGYGCTHDAFRVTDPQPQARGYSRCIQQALRDARLNVDDVDYFNAHGSATRANDRLETLALRRVFGRAADSLAISSIKSMIGHATTASGAIDMMACLLALRRGVIPPTINYRTPDPQCDLDYVPNMAREKDCRHVVTGNLGFGGQNAALVLSQFLRRQPR